MSTKYTCGNCQYFGPPSTNYGDKGKNECHANPPAVTEGEDWVNTRYPGVKPDAIACRFFVNVTVDVSGMFGPNGSAA